MSLLLWAVFVATGEGQTLVDLRTQTKSVDFSGAPSTKPMQIGSSLPSTCTVGQFFFLTSAPAGSNVYACGTVNLWTLQGSNLPSYTGSANELLSSSGGSSQWLALGGDIIGSPNSVTVKGLQGRAVGATAPSNGQVLEWNTTTSQWLPAAGQTGNAAYIFVSQTSLTIPGTVHLFGTANLIVDCFDSETPPQQVEADKIQINPTTYNVTINFATAQSGYCVVNGAGTASVSGGGGIPPVGGDIAGNTAAATVTGIQNRPVANTAPSSGQALVWSAAASMWQPATVAGVGGVTSVFGRTGVVASLTGDYTFGQIAGTVGSAQLPGAGGDLGGTLTAATVTGIQSRAVANTAPSSGQALLWNGSQWAPATIAGSGGAITSVFGRTGVVASLTGDYTFGQIAGTVGSTQLPGAGGDLGGTLTAATVTGIQSRAVANTAPSSGQALLWNGSQWAPATITGSGGATMAYQLGDLAVVLTSPTVLTIGANCASASPCNVRFGYQVYTITNSATATISGNATGAAYIYISGSGALVVGHNLTVACSTSCTQQTGVTSFPANVIPIFIWSATNGTWNGSGGLDQRAFMSSKALAGGQGIILTETPGQSTVAVDNGVIPTYLTASATLTFSSISNNACAPDQPLTVTGANPGDAVAPAWPSNLPSGVLGVMFVSSINTVNVRLCNLSGAVVTPPSNAFRATIVRNY